MFKIKKKFLIDKELSKIHPFCPFCRHKLFASGENNKCYKYYTEKIGANFHGIDKCPYKFSTYFTDDTLDFILTGFAIAGEKPEGALKTVDDTCGHGYLNSITYTKEEITLLIERYHKYKEMHECCAQLQHDIGNAIQYIYCLIDSVRDNEAVEGFADLFDGYDLIAEEIKQISNGPLKNFDLLTDWSGEIQTIILNIEKLESIIVSYKAKAFPLKDRFNCREESDLYCAVNGFLLIYNILYRDYGAFSFKAEHFDSMGYYKPFDIVLKTVGLLQHRAEEKEVKFPKFKGSNVLKIHNYECFSLAIFTLLDNAIKYCIEPRNILIEFKDLPTGHILISIANPSEYLSKEDIENITKKGYRGTNKSKDGNGLGLYVVNKIIKKCSSSITFKYVKGYFYAEIDLAPKY